MCSGFVVLLLSLLLFFSFWFPFIFIKIPLWKKKRCSLPCYHASIVLFNSCSDRQTDRLAAWLTEGKLNTVCCSLTYILSSLTYKTIKALKARWMNRKKQEVDESITRRAYVTQNSLMWGHGLANKSGKEIKLQL